MVVNPLSKLRTYLLRLYYQRLLAARRRFDEDLIPAVGFTDLVGHGAFVEGDRDDFVLTWHGVSDGELFQRHVRCHGCPVDATAGRGGDVHRTATEPYVLAG